MGVGFVQGVTSPCIFHHPKRDIITVVHGDDFTSLAHERDLLWLKSQFNTRFEIKDKGIMGPDSKDIKEVRLLNRIVAWDRDGIRIEADQRHAEILCRQLGLENSKGVDTPGVHESKEDDEQLQEYLSPDQATLYRGCAARCNFLSLDRPDIQFASKEISRGMARPTEGDLVRVKRLARYLKKYPRAAFTYKWQNPVTKLYGFSDTDWAGCLRTRKSTQGGLLIAGQHCVKSWSTTQAFISLSSGESEYYGIVKTCLLYTSPSPRDQRG